MKDNSGKVLLALLAGASAGVIAGLLMAPDSGEATRGSVKKWANKLSKDLEANLQASLDEIKNMGGDAYSKVSNAASSAVDSARDAVDSAKEKVTGGGASNDTKGGGEAHQSGGNQGGGNAGQGGGNANQGGANQGGGNAGGGNAGGGANAPKA